MVKATCVNETCTLKAKGKIKVKVRKASGKFRTRKFNLKLVKRGAAKGKTVTLRVKLPNKARRLVKRAMRNRKITRIRVTVWATDEAGNTRHLTRKVKVLKKKRKLRG